MKGTAKIYQTDNTMDIISAFYSQNTNLAWAVKRERVGAALLEQSIIKKCDKNQQLKDIIS